MQPTHKYKIEVTLDTSGESSIETVGIRGSGLPLSWDIDYPMQALVKDSLYHATFSIETGYKFGEYKFTINGKYELENQNNRRLYFSDSEEPKLRLYSIKENRYGADFF